MASKKQLLEIISIQTEIAKLGLDSGGVMSLVVNRMLDIVDADAAVIELREGHEMVYKATSSIASEFTGQRLDIKNSLSGLCINTGKVLISVDVENDERVNIELSRKIGLRSMIVVPLKYQNTTVGVLKALSIDAHKFTKNTANVLQLLSELIAASMFFSNKYDNNNLFHRATHDAMTNLVNRELFMDRLRNLILQGLRYKLKIGVLIIDMNGLKQINDTYGHQVGDASLIFLANRIKAATRISDTVARLGGDEFGVILNPIETKDTVAVSIERIHKEILSPFEFQGKDYHFSASIGASAFPEDADNLEDLLAIADANMYVFKKMHYDKTNI